MPQFWIAHPAAESSPVSLKRWLLWVIAQTLPGGMKNQPVRALCVKEADARSLAAAFKHLRLSVVPATLTLNPSRRKKAKAKRSAP